MLRDSGLLGPLATSMLAALEQRMIELEHLDCVTYGPVCGLDDEFACILSCIRPLNEYEKAHLRQLTACLSLANGQFSTPRVRGHLKRPRLG